MPSIRWSKIISGSFLPFPGARIHGRPIHGVAARRIAAVGPVHRPVSEVEFEVDGFRQIPHRAARCLCGSLAVWPFGISRLARKMRPSPALSRTFLSPIEFSAFDVERDSHAPFLYVLPRTRVAFAGIDKSFDLGTIQVRAHDPHAFAIAPVKLAVLLVELQLLGSEGAAGRNNVGNVASVKIRSARWTRRWRVGLPMLVQYRWPASVSTTMPSGRRRPSLTRTLRSEPSGFAENTWPLLALRKNKRGVVTFAAGFLDISI